MQHEDYQDLVAPDALDTLDENERRTLVAHLATCEDCRAERDALRASASALVYAAPAVQPAPELRTRILAAAIKSGAAQNDSTTPPVAAHDARTTTTAADAATNIISFEDSPAHRRAVQAREVIISPRVLMFGTLAASVALIALGLSLAVLWQRNHRLQSEVAQLSGNVNRTEQELLQTQQELARAHADRELLFAPEAQTATLAGTKFAERASARFTYNARTGRAILIAHALPPAPAGKAYQLWFIAGGRPPLPGSVFSPDASGHAELQESVPPAGRRGDAIFAITLEPSNGVSAPTGEIYLKSSAS